MDAHFSETHECSGRQLNATELGVHSRMGVQSWEWNGQREMVESIGQKKFIIAQHYMVDRLPKPTKNT